ncbi:MAG: hypothetical protein GY724_26520 [Actinomycetia bacterium]|nr:hypothetical protein [Actinomycetes bacterium]MCP4223242.1 hypothetical protein [Actinomycetes bacterium]MCP5033686.1 hypothetical protein [Actinomycetes bacterium]
MRVATIIIAFTGALLLTGCSSSEPEVSTDDQPGSLAEEMITGELATTVGLGPLTSTCNTPPVLAIDTTFECTAMTEAGEVIQIHGSVNPEGKLALVTTNLVSAPALPSFEREVAAILNDSVGSNFTAASVDCGSTAVVLPADFVMGCALVMPASREIFDVTLTISDLDQRTFSLLVSDQPRVAVDEGEDEEPVEG